MTSSKNIDRRTLLTTSAGALAAAILPGCSDDSGEPIDTLDPEDAAASADASASSTPSSSALPSATSASPTSASSDAGSSPSDAGESDGGVNVDSGVDAGSSDSGAQADGGGFTDASGADSGGTDDAGSGGSADGGGTMSCLSMVETVNNHTHVVNVPTSDIERGYQEAAYVLEDGGAGHIHTLALSGYDYAYLQAGSVIVVASSEDASHSHDCTISCAL